MTNLGSIRADMDMEWTSLRQSWQRTSAHWGDELHDRFEREFMDAYEPAIRAAQVQLDRLQSLLSEARRSVV